MSEKKGRPKLPIDSAENDVNSRFVDPRLIAREGIFQQLHMSIFDTMTYAQAIQSYVEKTGHDIESTNSDYMQLQRDYEITKNMTITSNTVLGPMCESTDKVLQNQNTAFANCAQLCASAINTLNHWRILSEVPVDLRDKDVVTKTLKEKFQQHLRTWQYIVEDLSGIQSQNKSS